MFYGRFTIEWTRQFNRYAVLENRTKNGGTWITGITEIIYNHLHLRWKHRSNIAHDAKRQPQTQAMTQLDNKIRDLYSHRNEIPRQRQQSFDIPLETLLKRSLGTKRAWLGNNENHIKKLIIQQLDTTIKELYTYQQHLPPTHHKLFKHKLEKLL